MEQFSKCIIPTQQLQESVHRLQQELEEKDRILAHYGREIQSREEELKETLASVERLLEDSRAESRKELAAKDSIIEQLMAENRDLSAAKRLPKIKREDRGGGQSKVKQEPIKGEWVPTSPHPSNSFLSL